MQPKYESSRPTTPPKYNLYKLANDYSPANIPEKLTQNYFKQDQLPFTNYFPKQEYRPPY